MSYPLNLIELLRLLLKCILFFKIKANKRRNKRLTELRYLELELHGVVAMFVKAERLQQLSHVRAQIARQYLRVTGRYGLQHGVVDEHVLVLGLHHVVTLRAQARHVTVDIHRVHVLDPLQHRVDHDERASSPHTRTEITIIIIIIITRAVLSPEKRAKHRRRRAQRKHVPRKKNPLIMQNLCIFVQKSCKIRAFC